MVNEEVDIIIIGAGAAGSAAAWNLSNSNYKIVCLEQGPQLDYKSFPKNKSEFIKNNNFNINPNNRKLDNDYPIDDSESPISVANFNAVGGSTILYSGHFPRMHPSDFLTRSKDNVGEDWLFEYSDLEEYYDINDIMMKVSGLSGDPSYPPIKNLLPPVPLGLSGEKIAKGFSKLNWDWWPSYSSIISNHYEYNKKKGIFNSGLSVDQTYIPLAKKNGVDFRANCRVVKINLDNFGNAKEAIYENENKDIIALQAKIIILACSGAGTPRLLLNSANKSNPNGLSNNTGLVGKNLMLHPLGYVEGVFDEYLESSFGPQGCCIASKEFYETREENDFKRGYTMHVLRGADPLDTAIALRKFKKLKFGNSFNDDFLSSYGKSIPIAIICEDLPEISNCIELDKDNLDSSNMPGIKIKYKLSSNTKKMMSHGINKAKIVLKEAGAKSLTAFGPVRHTGWHIMGTTKMGINPETSVVNQYGQSHEINNLLIVDSSVFNTSGGVNPMSTIQALALKLTSELLKNPHRFELRS